MSPTHTVVEGTLRSDGTLELDARPNLPSGRVQVTLSLLNGALNNEIEAQIAKLSKLRDNWDGYGSPPVTDVAVAMARKLAKALLELKAPVPQVCPVSGGGLGWTLEVCGRRLELEILPSGGLEYLTVNSNEPIGDREEEEGTFRCESGTGENTKLERLVDWLRGE